MTPAMGSELAVQALTSGDAPPARWLMFLHGILGRGGNWRGIARRTIARAPTWGALLVDLRAHGDSRGLTPPDTVARCAADLAGYAATLEAPVEGVLGHSFGGKVALAYAEDAPALRKLFVVDSYPGPRPGGRGSESVLRVLGMLGALPPRFAERDDFVAHVTGAGFSEGLARWLAQSLDRGDDGTYAFGLDLARIKALLDDYFARDLTPVIDPPRAGLEACLVVGERSEVFGEEERAHAEELAARHAGVEVAVVPDAGHWIHADAPERLVALLAERLA